MPNQIEKAIKTRWDNHGLDNTVTGGLHDTLPPPRTSYPYTVYSQISGTRTGKTNTSDYRDHAWQFSIFGSKSEVVASMDAILDVFNEEVDLVLEGGKGTLLNLTLDTELLTRDLDDDARSQGVLGYTVTRATDRRSN